MSSKLRRLVYISRNRMPPAELPANIDSILATSRRNNAMVDVTGALIFNHGIFAQVLEGTTESIETTFERIQQDERHGGVEVLGMEPIAQRRFPFWSMGFLGRSKEAENLFAYVSEASGFEARRMQGEKILEVMQRVALEEESTAA